MTMNAITATSGNHGGGGSGMIPQNMEQAIRMAEMMSRGKLMPAHLHNSPGDCLMVVEMAMRFGMSPFAVAQCTSVIQGKLMLEGKLVAAALHGSGALLTRLDYHYEGEGASRAVSVSAVLVGETEPRTIIIMLADVKTSNQLWTKQPDQQLAYSGARNWARRFAPEVMLGVYSPEEMTVEHEHAHPLPVNLNPPQTRETINAEVPLLPTPKPTITGWLDSLETDLAEMHTTEDVETIINGDRVQAALTKLTNGALTRLNAIVAKALARTSANIDAFEPETAE